MRETRGPDRELRHVGSTYVTANLVVYTRDSVHCCPHTDIWHIDRMVRHRILVRKPLGKEYLEGKDNIMMDLRKLGRKVG